MNNNKVGDDAYQQIATSFRTFDLDGDNSISRVEMKEILLKISTTDNVQDIDEDVERLFRICDRDGSGSISFNEFFHAQKNKRLDQRDADVMTRLVGFFGKGKQEQEKIIKSNEEHYIKLKQDLENAIQNNSNNERHIAETKEKHEQETQRLKEEHEKLHAEKDDTIVKLREHIEELKKGVENTNNAQHLHGEQEKEIQTLKEIISDLEKQVKQYVANNAVYEQEVKDLREKLLAAEEKAQKREEELEQQSKSHAENEHRHKQRIQQTENELENAQEENDRHTEKEEKLNQHIAQLQGELVREQEKLAEEENKLNALFAQIHALKKFSAALWPVVQ